MNVQIRRVTLMLALLALPWVALAGAGADVTIGSVVTNRHMMSPNDTIEVVRFEDPGVAGAFCYLSSAQTGGAASMVGMQESPSEYTLNCFAEGTVRLPANLPDAEDISSSKRSALFKRMYVTRLVDRQAHRLVYVAYTRYLTDGSPKHAMASLPYTP